MKPLCLPHLLALAALVLPSHAQQSRVTVLHAAHLLDVAAGKLVSPGEVLIEGTKIREVGPQVTHPASVQVIDLGGATLMPGLIDAHTHLFLHVGDEAYQTVKESVPQRTLTQPTQPAQICSRASPPSAIWARKVPAVRMSRCATRLTAA